MVIVIATTLALDGISNWGLIAAGAPSGRSASSAPAPKMTAMPQMVALFNGVGGGAAALVAPRSSTSQWRPRGRRDRLDRSPALIGSISFSGSLVAFVREVAEPASGRPIVFSGQNLFNSAILLGAAALGVALVAGVDSNGP